MSRPSTILLLSDNVGSEYIGRIEQGVAGALQSSRFTLVSHNIYGTSETVADLIGRQSYAGIVLTAPLADDRGVIARIEALSIPFVRIAPLLDLDRGSIVTMDEFDAARAITEHLLQRGHRQIGFVKGPREHLVSIRRFNGFASALGGHGLRVDPALVVLGDFSRASGREQGAALLAKRPSAIFASNDEMAIGVLEAARARGIDVPGDLSVVGFDGDLAASRVQPPITTIRQPLGEMGAAAAQILVDRIERPGSGSENAEVRFELVERASVGALAA